MFSQISHSAGANLSLERYAKHVPAAGDTRRRCKAKKSNGDPCTALAMRGQMICYHHGGAAPQTRAAAARRLAEEETRQRLAESLKDAVPFTGVGDVYEELLTVAGVSKAWREVLQGRVEELQKYGYDSNLGTEQLKTDVALFERALERSAKIGEALARLNLEERKAALDERIAGQLVAVMRATFAELGLSPEQEARAAVVLPAKIKELTA